VSTLTRTLVHGHEYGHKLDECNAWAHTPANGHAAASFKVQSQDAVVELEWARCFWGRLTYDHIIATRTPCSKSA